MTTERRVRHPLIELTLARLYEFIREPEALFWAFVFPIIMSVTLAIAFPARGTRPIAVGLAVGPGASSLRRALAAAPELIVRDVAAADEARALREGEVYVVVVPTTPPTYRFDPARGESRAARLAVDRALKRAEGHADPWTAREQPLVVPGSRYIDWLIPGIVGIERDEHRDVGDRLLDRAGTAWKLLKRLVASPMRKRDYLTAQMLARMVFLAPEVAVPLAFGMFVLGMPVHGSVIAIAVVAVVGGLSFTALGLLAASRARSLEAISGILNLPMLPMWVLSGVIFSTANFPETLQPFIQALPLTALNDALRAVILEGAGVAAVGGELLLLGAWGAVPFALALRLFRWV